MAEIGRAFPKLRAGRALGAPRQHRRPTAAAVAHPGGILPDRRVGHAGAGRQIQAVARRERAGRAADRDPVDLGEGRGEHGGRPDLRHRAWPGDAVRVVLVVPPLEHALLGRDALPAVGLEDRGDVHCADKDAEQCPVTLEGERPAQVQVDGAAGLVPGAVGDARLIAAEPWRPQGIGEGRQNILPRAGDDRLAHLGEAGRRERVQPWVGCLYAGQAHQRLGRAVGAALLRWHGLCM